MYMYHTEIDVRLRDADRAIYSAEDMNLEKLSEFSDFVEQYLTPSKIHVKKCTKDTSYNIIARYWSNLQYTYCRLTMIISQCSRFQKKCAFIRLNFYYNYVLI